MWKASGTTPLPQNNEVSEDKVKSKLDTVLIICLWIISSNLFNASSKFVSSSNPWTAFVTTTTQFGGTTLIGVSAMKFNGCNFSSFILPLKRVFPIGIGLAVANGSMMWALSRTSIGMFQTIKASSPLFTAFACHVILGRRYTTRTYVSLLPIILGLAAASATDLEVDTLGAIACVLSSVSQVFVNLSAKQLLEKTFPDLDQDSLGKQRFLKPYELQSLVSIVGFATCLLSLLTAMGYSLVERMNFNAMELDKLDFDHLFPAFHLVAWNVLLYSLENVSAYATNGKLPRLPFAVVDAVRRLSIVVSFNIVFTERRPSYVNILGVLAVAVGAVSFAHVAEER